MRHRQGERVYLSISAQPDNLGDIEIRRTVLEWVLETNAEVVVYTGAMPQGYVDAFPKAANCVYSNSAAAFEASLIGDCLRRRASIVFAPGPQLLRSRATAWAKQLANLLNCAMVRATGGAVVGVGRAYRGETRVGAAIERRLLNLFDMAVVRDAVSNRYIERDLPVVPDVAFLPRSDADVLQSTDRLAPRLLAAISLRGDRPSNAAVLAPAVDELSRRGLTPVFVTQVQRDELQHENLARALGIGHVSWGSHTHGEQIGRVRATYARSAVVVSNRLHAILLGLQEGALGVPITEGEDKLGVTLLPWTTLPSTPTNFETVAGQRWADFAIEWTDSLLREYADAQTRVDAARQDVQRLLMGEQPPGEADQPPPESAVPGQERS